MAHHQHNQQDSNRRTSALQSLLKMFTLKNAPTIPPTEDEAVSEADEPPDDQISPLQPEFPKMSKTYTKARPAMTERRESLLTQAIVASGADEPTSPSNTRVPRGASARSSHSTASMASTAELTSDGGLTGSSRSASPSPPLPPSQYAHLPSPKSALLEATELGVAPAIKHDEVAVLDVGEAAVEKALGRKRCIGFACGNVPTKPKEEAPTPKAEPTTPAEPPRRKCMISFACPKSDKTEDLCVELARTDSIARPTARQASPAPLQRQQTGPRQSQQADTPAPVTQGKEQKLTGPVSPQTFHEFGSSQDEPDAWVDRPIDNKHKLTLNDCMKKENAIRKMGEEAEEEAEQEEEEEEEEADQEEEADGVGHEDDFAPSDDSSNGGNESDDEDGFAQSDDDSDAGSEDQFWAPAATTAATSTDNIDIHQTLSHFSARQRSTASSPESSTSPSRRLAGHDMRKSASQRRAQKLARLRPGTPELPDSTDFVCGTLDEDRPLEAAYISCREQKKLEKHVPIPQDIDPSFPTTDPEDNDDDDDNEVEVDDADADADDHLWFKDQLVGIDNEKIRGRRKSSTIKHEIGHGSAAIVPAAQMAAAKLVSLRPPPPRAKAHRSPPPKARTARSPPPRRLFGHSPTALRSPPAPVKLRSPRGSPTARPYALGITINRLAQRPHMGRTASLPQTPNPFFRNYKNKSPTLSTVTSGIVSPGDSDATPRADMHVRGPVDIVIGLEKKRQKRKEKFWRLHCRKAAKEQAEKKPVPGRGAERMKELGLECAERNRGYGLGPTAQLVISL